MKKLVKANDGKIVKVTNNKIVTKRKFSVTDPDGSKQATKFKTTAENLGTKENPKAGYDTMKTRITNTDPSGKKTTTVTKTDKYGDPRRRKGIIPVRKKGGVIKKK